MEKIKSITEVEPIENMLKIGNYLKLYRINYGGYRLYINENPFSYYSGLTGALSASTFSGDRDKKRLDNWRNSMINDFGQKSTEYFVEMTADFGTLLHMALVTIKEQGKIKWEEEKDKAYDYFLTAFKQKGIEPNFRTLKKIVYEYQKHVASLLQFIFDCVHEIYAIETPAILDELKIATPIDLFCSCRQTPKGEFKNTTINLKTSSAINKHQISQVAMEFVMWNTTYPEMKADFTAILRSKDWNESKTPTYEYKYLNKDEISLIFARSYKRLALCLNDEDSSYFPSPVSKLFVGETKIGEKPVVIEKTLEEEWIETLEQK